MAKLNKPGKKDHKFVKPALSVGTPPTQNKKFFLSVNSDYFSASVAPFSKFEETLFYAEEVFTDATPLKNQHKVIVNFGDIIDDHGPLTKDMIAKMGQAIADSIDDQFFKDHYPDLTKPNPIGIMSSVAKSMEKPMPYSVALWQFGETETTKGVATPEILGGKGCGLVEMARLGLPVPPGIIIPTGLSQHLLKHAGVFHGTDDSLIEDVAQEVNSLILGYIAPQLGYQSGTHPLVSVRSGARVSMPGMMDTILNVGISKKNLTFWQNKLGDKAALDCLARLMKMYGTTVCGIGADEFDHCLTKVMKFKYGQPELPTSEKNLSVDHQWKLIEKYTDLYGYMNRVFPDDLQSQLGGAIGAVFQSWNSPRAKAYRKLNKIPDDWGTACVVQAMVFGNANDQSCSGVLFSRNPSNGDIVPMGEFLPNAQGEEVVAGTATPIKISAMFDWNSAAYSQLMGITHKLECHNKDMVDIEFTVESGKLHILQVRTGKRSALAAFRIAYTLVKEGIITQTEALKRVTAQQYQLLAKSGIDPNFKGNPLATGLAGSKGIATGKIWFSSAMAQTNPGGILVTKETTPDDFSGMAASVGILTATGGLTSHAAVVARGMDRACVVGCTAMILSDKQATFHGDTGVIDEGDVITLDGNTGHVYLGTVPMVGGVVPEFVEEMIQWGVKKEWVLQYDADDNLPEEGEIFINCLSLKTKDDLMNLMERLSYRPKLAGILTFHRPPEFDDSPFLKALALPTGEGHKMSFEQAQTVCKEMADHDAAKNWTVMGLVGDTGKFRPFKKIFTLKDFSECEGYYEIDPTLEALLVKEGLSVKTFAALLEKSGKSLKQVSKPILREQLPFTVFG